MKQVIFNADDFGFTRDVNAGIVHAHLEGVLTATTLMANGDAFDDAVRLAHATPTLDVGCHLVLVQGFSVLDGRPLPSKLSQVWQRYLLGGLKPYAELRAQVEKIVAAGIRPTHLDSHKHTHILPGVFAAVVRLAQEFHIPYVRLPLDRTAPYARRICQAVDPLYRKQAERKGVRLTDHFLGYRLTGSLDESLLLQALHQLEEGTTEFMCHPGFLGDELQASPTRLKASRVKELAALTSPRVRHAMAAQSIRLATFRTAAPPAAVR